MIKIRYADLPGGLHARAEARGRHTVIIYLLPGLTVPQRRAALRRLRRNARVGHGPELSRAGMARAIFTDRVRTNLRNAGAALRVHPGILAPPLVLSLAAAVAFVVLVPVPVGINSSPASNPKALSHRPPGSQNDPPPSLHGGGVPLVPAHPKRANPRTDRVGMLGQLEPDPFQGVPPPSPTPSSRPKRTARPTPTPTVTPSPTASPTASPTPSPTPSRSPGPAGNDPPGGMSSCPGLGLNLAVLSACL